VSQPYPRRRSHPGHPLPAVGDDPLLATARSPTDTDSGAPSMSVTQENGAITAEADDLTTFDLEALTANERVVVAIIARLRADGDAASLRAWAREGGEALERVREALEVLGELDPPLLIALALDGLVCAQTDDGSDMRQSR
jgi:hypothetical protein